MATAIEHFIGCHPRDGKAPATPEGYEPRETEACWHCGTPTSRGCGCGDCEDAADVMPPTAVYHCRRCGRWWSYMRLNVTKITFGEKTVHDV